MRGSSQRRRRINRRYWPSLEHGSVGGVALEPRVLLNAASPARLNSGALAARFEQASVRQAHRASASHPYQRVGPVQEINTQYAEGLFHMMEGWVIFMVALVALLLLHQVLIRGSRLLNRRKAAA